MGERTNWEGHYEAARTAWPDLAVSLAEFCAFVEPRGIFPDDATLRAGDLYLACACTARKRGALEAFDDVFGAEIETAWRRVSRLVPSKDDAMQVVRQRLFAGESPRIGQYSGRGSLKAWVRVVALRALLNRRESRGEPFENDAEVELLVASGDPELELIKSKHAQEFREALASCARALDAKERTLLRLAFVDQLTVDALGNFYGVHRSTAARWVRSAHEELVRRVRSTLCERLGMTSAELDSLQRLVVSALDTTLSRYLSD